MTHRRQPSDGLNVGEGFPTSYSSFSVTSDARADGRRSSGSPRGTALESKAPARKRRISSPPLVPLEGSPKLQGGSTGTFSSYSNGTKSPSSLLAPASPKITFDTSGPGVTTRKSTESVYEGFKKRWIFVIFFIAFCAFVGLGTLLPVSRGLGARDVRGRRESTYLARATRSMPATVLHHEYQPSRFAKWADALLGGSAGAIGPKRAGGRLSAPVPLPPAGLGDLEMPDFASESEGQQSEAAQEASNLLPETIGISTASGRRGTGKRRNVNQVDKDAHEHPRRKERRQDSQHKSRQSLSDEIMERERAMSKRKQLRNRVMARVAKAYKEGLVRRLGGRASEDDSKGDYVTGYRAAHPEEGDIDGAYED